MLRIATLPQHLPETRQMFFINFFTAEAKIGQRNDQDFFVNSGAKRSSDPAPLTYYETLFVCLSLSNTLFVVFICFVRASCHCVYVENSPNREMQKLQKATNKTSCSDLQSLFCIRLHYLLLTHFWFHISFPCLHHQTALQLSCGRCCLESESWGKSWNKASAADALLPEPDQHGHAAERHALLAVAQVLCDFHLYLRSVSAGTAHVSV